MYIVVVVVFCVFFHVLFSDLEWIPTFQSRSPKALTRPAIVGIFVPPSWAGNHWVQVWNHWNFGRSNWGCHRAQKLRHPCTKWKKLWGLDQTIPDYTWLPDLFGALKCRSKSLFSHILESHGKSSAMLHTAPVLPKIAKACVRVRRNYNKSFAELYSTASGVVSQGCIMKRVTSFRTCDHRRLDCHFSWEGLVPSKQSKSRNQMESGGKPMKDDGSWEVALEVNRLTRRGTFCGCRFWWK